MEIKSGLGHRIENTKGINFVCILIIFLFFTSLPVKADVISGLGVISYTGVGDPKMIIDGNLSTDAVLTVNKSVTFSVPNKPIGKFRLHQSSKYLSIGFWSNSTLLYSVKSEQNKVEYLIPNPIENVTKITITNVNNGSISVGLYELILYTPEVPPNPPQNLKVNGSGSTGTLTWDNVVDASSYYIYDGINKISEVTSNSYNFSDISVGTHIFYVSAVNQFGESQKSVGVTYNTSPPAPILQIDNITATTANLIWNSNTKVNSYDIYINGSFLSNTITNSYVLANLNENTSYSISVIAKSSSGNSDPSNVTFNTLSLPDPPTGLNASNITTDSIDLTWNSVQGSISYILDRDGNIVASTGGNTYKVSGLIPNTSYTFRVAVETQAGQSVYSNPVEIKTLGIPPETPSGLSYDNLTTSGFKIYWLRQENTDSYNVYLNNVLIENIPQTLIYNPSYTFKGLDPNKGYNVSIVAINEWGMSSNSEPLTVTTIAEPPSDLRAFDITNNSVKLSWQSVQGAMNYILDQNGNIIATTTDTEYQVTGLTPNTYYQFRVAVETEAGTSEYSPSVEVKTLGVTPDPPSGLSIDYLTDASFTLYWLKQADAKSYDIYLDGVFVANVNQPLILNPKYEFDNLNPSTSYNISIIAKNEHGQSEASSPFTVTTLATPPNGLLRVSNITSSSAELKWNPVSGATNYELYQDNVLIAVLSDTSFIVTGLEPLTSYSFKMSVDGSQDYTEILTFTTLGIPPEVPGGLSYTNLEDKSFVLTWDEAEGSSSYNLFLNGIFISNVTETSYRFENLTPNSQYIVTINAQNTWGTSEMSSEIEVMTLPEPPSGFKAINITSNTVSLTWNPVEGALSYHIKKDDEIIATIEDGTFTIDNLTSSTKYKFQVSVTTAAGQSEFTDPVNLTTLGAPPDKPMDLSLSNIKRTSFTINWPNQDNVKYYNIYLNEYLFKKVSHPTNSFTFTGLQENQAYKVKIVAANEWGQSPASDPLVVMTTINPYLSVSVDGTNLKLKWDGKADAFLVMVNGQQVAATNKKEYVYEGKLGKEYELKVVSVVQGKTFESNVVYRNVSSIPLVGASQVTQDFTDNVKNVVVPMGSLLALALALKGSPVLVGIAKMVMRWF